jgi:N-acyl-D-aspartate/D-glutamate deacylase
MRWWWLPLLAALGCQASAMPRGGPAAGASSAPASAERAAASATPSAATSIATSASAPVPPAPPFTSSDEFDVLFADGKVVDGTGAATRVTDVLIDGGRIVHVGDVADSVNVKQRIDARGLVVAPGFIDTHAHGDARDPQSNFLAMGVTTLCLGQDGRSPGQGSMRAWVAGLAGHALAANVVPFVGHATIRARSKVGFARHPSTEQLARMEAMVADDLAAGAWGVTTGLEYSPGVLAEADELAAIARPAGRVDGVVMSHMRSENDDEIDAALDELVNQGKASGARVHVSHIKVVYGKGVERADRLLAKLAKARAEGVAITADIYPYNASYTGISIVFPDYAKAPNSFQRAKTKRRDELARYLRDRVTKRGGPAATLFGTPPELRGKTLADLSKERGKPFEDVLIDDIGPSGAGAAYFVMDDALQARLLLDPHVMIATDGSGGSQHPRGFGAFAKVIRRFVVEDGRLSIEQAVHKMTGLPAATLRLERARRGLLKSGWAADVVVFDPAEVRDRASYEAPQRLAKGMRWVLVNGVAAVKDGKLSGRRGGRVLVRQGAGTRPGTAELGGF